MVLDNDTRGWIMTAVSGTASIICVDILIRFLPGKRHFRIQDSNLFLSSSLSLSFGVMIFSSLYSMLPSSKSSLQRGGFSSKAAAWTLIGCFLAGVVGIQVVSRVLHHYIPHSVVDCDHSHDDEDSFRMPDAESHKKIHTGNDSAGRTMSHRWRGSGSYSTHQEIVGSSPLARRPSLQTQISAKVSQLVSGPKALCDENGQCFGYSEPCGQECFKIVQARGGSRLHPSTSRPSGLRSATTSHVAPLSGEHQPLLHNVDENTPLTPVQPDPSNISHWPHQAHSDEVLTTLNGSLDPDFNSGLRRTQSTSSISIYSAHSHQSHAHSTYQPHAHHHHVPTNAFLSIGLQTSIAIALHKLPEGFITYATNHANPRLGFSVFLALFIHNITEGFAMALPLYLAINSRWKAMFWSSLLGGASQPLGAGGVYGAMFAVTAGIMASVALQLFGESLDLTHSRNLCMIFAFVGMGILGVSSALTA
ncbi:hypothetical protein AOQ84DRAFT_295629 [Glonium stellatum]|uniref:Zinc/iron permease n=1 Tax=Glonium stellatum TaxID=574774 RepID=A0A8E2EYL8_9PEZI|nr:hypothetical protein AOQ84DRAFT_295629 [Glonium stellatum]